MKATGWYVFVLSTAFCAFLITLSPFTPKHKAMLFATAAANSFVVNYFAFKNKEAQQ